jgi:nitroreductase
MELQQAISGRYSVRSYQDKPVPRQKLEEIMEMVSMAPSAVNYQPWHFIVITAKSGLEALWPVYHRQWLQSAPVIIVACINHHESWKRNSDGKDFGEADVAIAIDHLTLVATAAGLGTCWICNFDVPASKRILELPDYLEPLALIPLGFPATAAPLKKRKSLREIVSWEKFDK